MCSCRSRCQAESGDQHVAAGQGRHCARERPVRLPALAAGSAALVMVPCMLCHAGWLPHGWKFQPGMQCIERSWIACWQAASALQLACADATAPSVSYLQATCVHCVPDQSAKPPKCPTKSHHIHITVITVEHTGTVPGRCGHLRNQLRRWHATALCNRRVTQEHFSQTIQVLGFDTGAVSHPTQPQ
jgi:hypothetical protein